MSLHVDGLMGIVLECKHLEMLQILGCVRGDQHSFFLRSINAPPTTFSSERAVTLEAPLSDSPPNASCFFNQYPDFSPGLCLFKYSLRLFGRFPRKIVYRCRCSPKALCREACGDDWSPLSALPQIYCALFLRYMQRPCCRRLYPPSSPLCPTFMFSSLL